MEGVPRPTLLPTKVRHLEAALATTLWLAFLPAAFYVGSGVLNTVILVLVIALAIHAYSMRPYCTELDEEEVEAMGEVIRTNEPVKAGAYPGLAIKETSEEYRLVILIIVLLCTVGCSISFSMGGGQVVHQWLLPTAADCSMKDIAKIESTHPRFHCSDGFVDLAQQRSLMAVSGSLVKTYTAYRIVPVYEKESPSKKDLPVAWAVSKNEKFTSAPCGGNRQGLCGIFIEKDPLWHEAIDKANYKTLKKLASDEMVKGGASDKFDQDSIPAVSLTNLANPNGRAIYLYMGGSFYIIVLIGLINTQKTMLMEPASKLDADRIFGVDRPGYDPLQDRVSSNSIAME